MSSSLHKQWLAAKEMEASSIQRRREIEDQLAKQIGLSEQDEGSKTHSIDGYAIKVTQRHTKKIDAELLQEIANHEGMADNLSTLFRWKPEINKKVWDSAPEDVTKALAGAITVKPGRPSFSITLEESK